MGIKQLLKCCVFYNDDRDECAICKLKIEKNGIITSPFACGHRFHRDCINDWIKRKQNCPGCDSILINNNITQRRSQIINNNEWAINLSFPAI